MHGASARPSTPTPLPGPRCTTSSLSSQLAASLPGPRGVASAEHADKRVSGKEADRESPYHVSSAPPPAPFTPRRLSFPGRLSLQMPSRGPLSPVLDPALGYSVARRPRLDFARACTSLHHSTLAEQPSPDSSPLNHTCFPIPRNNRGCDSPITNYHGSSHASSLGSTCMLDYIPSGDDSDSSSDEDLDVDLDIDLTTPSTPAMPNNESASISLMNHQKARLAARGSARSRHSSNSSASASNSSLASPSPTTPPVAFNSGGGYFGRSSSSLPSGIGEAVAAARRKEGGGLREVLRSSFKVGAGRFVGNGEEEKDRPDPIRRPVSRRGSLLPKTKNFQRIKAALIEEASPVDMEVKREAEITRQIREDDPTPSPAPQTSQDTELSDIREEDESMGSYGDSGVRGISFSKQAQKHGGFWFGDQMEGLSGSPPQFPGLRMSTDGDIMMNSESVVNSPVAGISVEIRCAKRRRTQDDRFDQNVFKRRAVSPGLCHSPILAASPPLVGGGGGKRLNFQGMSDTHDAIMKMSIQ